MDFILPSFVTTALNLIENSGFEGYIVGGCVRDTIMNKEPNDWDITTSATPEEMKKIFSEYRTIDTGIKHGTVTVIIENNFLEITTMRLDGEYKDNRRPEYVVFTKDIVNDLSRRDYTMNAIAYNPNTGLIDPFDGLNDIKNKIIRCVGEPDKRFNEDALRIIRGLRFSSTLGFIIEERTAQSIIKNKALLQNVANERIRVELLKLLCGKDVKRILLDFSTVIFEIIPELAATYKLPQRIIYHIYDVWEHTAVSVESVEPNPILRMTMLLHDVGKPDMHTVDSDGIDHFKGHQKISYEKTINILKRLRFSKAETELISKLILNHDIRPSGEPIETMQYAAELGVDFFKMLYSVFRADAMAQNPALLKNKMKELSKSEQALEIAEKKDLCLSVKDLNINGKEVAKCGYSGSEIGECLKMLLKEVIDGSVENEKEKLIEYIKNASI